MQTSRIKYGVMWQFNQQGKDLPKLEYITQVESLVQDAKNMLHEQKLISVPLYQKMHKLYMYI